MTCTRVFLRDADAENAVLQGNQRRYLTVAEIQNMSRELRRRSLFQEVPMGSGRDVMWTGSMEGGVSAHPRSTSVVGSPHYVRSAVPGRLAI